ncbi:hypothetical protein [uncultured Kordia sp.]|uniref:hypothetical protein n=1 Tax=uncultured Kordia sp. TaxID=507699 RepID=UPI0026378545|nr:hypothetical protein [uncultured Kordia sp.]
MITIIVAGIVLVAAVYFGKKYTTSKKVAENTEYYNQFSDEAYIEFAKKLEQSIHTKKPDFFDESVNLASFFSFSQKELEGSLNKRRILNAAKPILKFGKNISSSILFEKDFKFVRFYKENGVPHIIFRIYSPQFINFVDFTVGIKKDTLVLNDAYNFISGINFSDIISDIYYKSINSNSASLSNVKTYRKIQSGIEVGTYEEAYNLLTSIPEKNRDALHYQFLLIAASNLDDDKFLEVIAQLKAQKPDDKRLHAYLDFRKNVITGDIDQLNTAIDALKEYVGEDPVFDLFRGLMYYYQGDSETSSSFFNHLIANVPDFYDAYLYKLCNYILDDKTTEALEIVVQIKDRFSIDEKAFTEELFEFKAFTSSEAFKNIFKSAE